MKHQHFRLGTPATGEAIRRKAGRTLYATTEATSKIYALHRRSFALSRAVCRWHVLPTRVCQRLVAEFLDSIHDSLPVSSDTPGDTYRTRTYGQMTSSVPVFAHSWLPCQRWFKRTFLYAQYVENRSHVSFIWFNFTVSAIAWDSTPLRNLRQWNARDFCGDPHNEKVTIYIHKRPHCLKHWILFTWPPSQK